MSRGGGAWEQQSSLAVWSDSFTSGPPGTDHLFAGRRGQQRRARSGRRPAAGAHASGWATGPTSFARCCALPGRRGVRRPRSQQTTAARSGRPRERHAGSAAVRGTAAYHWHVMRPRAQPTAGDQRINSFGIGGDIEIRSGLLTQKQAITGTAGPLRPRHTHRRRSHAHRLAERHHAGRFRSAGRRADRCRAAPEGLVSVGVRRRRRPACAS